MKVTDGLKLLKMEIDKEPWMITLKLEQQPFPIRLTYSKRKGGVIKEIEEIDLAGNQICSCSFKGKSASGPTCQDWIKELKPILSQFKVSDWVYTTQFIEEHARTLK